MSQTQTTQKKKHQERPETPVLTICILCLWHCFWCLKLPVLRFCEALARGVQKSQAAATKQAIGLLDFKYHGYRESKTCEFLVSWVCSLWTAPNSCTLQWPKTCTRQGETNEDLPDVWLPHFGAIWLWQYLWHQCQHQPRLQVSPIWQALEALRPQDIQAMGNLGEARSPLQSCHPKNSMPKCFEGLKGES